MKKPPITKKAINRITLEYINDFNSKRKNEKICRYIVKDSIPVIWFGDLRKYENSKKRILTIAINPSANEFQGNRFIKINLRKITPTKVNKLQETLNDYFCNNPYMRWFNQYEKLLNNLDATYFCCNHYRNHAIHIDIYTAIATKKSWSKLDKNVKKAFDTILFKKLYKILNPDIALISVREDTFNEIFNDATFLVEYNKKKNNRYKKHKAMKNTPYVRLFKRRNKHIIWGTNWSNPFSCFSDKTLTAIMEDIRNEIHY